MPPRASVDTAPPDQGSPSRRVAQLLHLDDDGVTGIVPARIPRDDSKPLRQDIDNLALTLIAPLGADYNCCFCSHLYPVILSEVHRGAPSRRTRF